MKCQRSCTRPRSVIPPGITYGPLHYAGGPIVSNPEFVSLFLGPFAQNEIDAMESYLTELANYISGTLIGIPTGEEPVLRQYGVIGASVGQSLVYGNAFQFRVEGLPTAIPLAAVPDFAWIGLGPPSTR